jgi:hypothetical protein
MSFCRDSQETPEASPNPLPPPPRTSFISGKKKKTFGKFFGKVSGPLNLSVIFVYDE